MWLRPPRAQAEARAKPAELPGGLPPAGGIRSPLALEAFRPMAHRVTLIRLPLVVAAAALLPSLTVAAAAQDAPPRYLAVLQDGTEVTGNIITPWHYTGAHPKLGDRLLFEDDNPVRWLRDVRVTETEPEAFVEFAGGDRLPGTVLRYVDRDETAHGEQTSCLVVKPAVPLSAPNAHRDEVRVSLRWVQRIIWQASGRPKPYQPMTAFLRDGRQFAFRSVRFQSEGVRLLLDAAVEQVAFHQLKELHLAQQPAWDAYFEQLAILGSDQGTLIERVVTTEGLRATSTAARLQARWHHSHDVQNWYHGIQPAWAFEPLWVRFVTICQRRYHRPHEVPISRLHLEPLAGESRAGTPGALPVGADSLSLAAASHWPWQLDRNVHGDRLRCAGQEFDWGVGVHAPCQLRFEIPSCAEEFVVRLGLDESVGGRGGCVKASILQGQRSLYASGFLVGSRELQEPGPLKLLPTQPREVTLAVDACYGARPAGTDPLNIRDMLNWLEGTIVLDPAGLAQEVARRAGDVVPAWEGWQLEPAGERDPAAVTLVATWDKITNPEQPAWRVQTQFRLPWTRLTRQVEVPPAGAALRIEASQFAEQTTPAVIQVEVDGVVVGHFDVPRRSSSGDVDPIVVPLEPYAGQKVELAIVPWPLGEKSLIDWRRINLVEMRAAP